MWWLILQFVLTALGSAGHPAPLRADTGVTHNFAMIGTLQSGARIEGTLTVDASTGQAVAAKVSVEGTQVIAFNHVQGQASLGYAYVVTLTQAENPRGCPYLTFGERSTPGNFQGYSGGPLGPRTHVGYCNGLVDGIASGRLVPIIAVGGNTVSF